MKKKYLLGVLFATSLVLPGLSVADDQSHLEQVEILFKLTRMEQKINDSVDSVAQLQLRQNPNLDAAKRQQLMAFLERYIGWNAVRADLYEMYMQTFTEEELKTINDFYITTTGQKVIVIVPQLVQERNRLSMQSLQQNIGELQAIMSAGEPHR
ncbi:DUF2059 domain-containing protein [Gammaproteobacteria bacterium]|nr:DUF2059 domain-containing protein [Gammaproteobacteria bacterium]